MKTVFFNLFLGETQEKPRGNPRETEGKPRVNQREIEGKPKGNPGENQRSIQGKPSGNPGETQEQNEVNFYNRKKGLFKKNKTLLIFKHVFGKQK